MVTNITKGENMYTQHLEEVEPGIYERKDAGKSTSELVETHYTDNAVDILKRDQYHYQCMARRFADSPIFTEEFHSVADIAGGHPKLATLMNVCGDITVYDQYAAMYEELHDEFIELYPTDTPIKYEKKQVTHPNFTPNAELAVCSHMLEHLSLDQIRKLLGNLETDKLVVYGPNVSRAKNRKWLHFRPDDHKTFATIEAMCGLITEAGFTVVEATPYHEDYLIYADKK